MIKYLYEDVYLSFWLNNKLIKYLYIFVNYKI